MPRTLEQDIFESLNGTEIVDLNDSEINHTELEEVHIPTDYSKNGRWLREQEAKRSHVIARHWNKTAE